MGFATWNAVNPILLLKFLDKSFSVNKIFHIFAPDLVRWG